MLGQILSFWPLILTVIERSAAVLGCAHVVLHKRDTRAASAWAGLILLTPIFGSLLYVMFGINRLRRRGGELQSRLDTSTKRIHAQMADVLGRHEPSSDEPTHTRPAFVRVIGELTGWQLLPGNTVEPLIGGDAAYPAMLDAIAQAKRTVGLCSYIFHNDNVGKQFIDALVEAQQRGVTVRVLVDDMGSGFLFKSAVRHMKARGLTCASFLPALARRTIHLGNLRNHRKLLVVDGRVGFTGGMNIHGGCIEDCPPKRRVIDMHFRVTGPVVTHMTEAFAADWLFARGEALTSDAWFPANAADGHVWARGIPDGPDEDFEKMLVAILAAIEAAQQRIDIVTPYFLPDERVLQALHLVSLRGVRVRAFVPSKSDHRLVQWANHAMQRYALEAGCELYLTPPPFDHTKLMLVDGDWSLIGSTNWDPRSLSLNFEFNIECHDTSLNATLSAFVERYTTRAAKVTMNQVKARSLPIRLRNGAVRLLTPYL